MFIIKALIESVNAFYWWYLKFNFKNQVQQTTSITFHAQNLMLNIENYLPIIFPDKMDDAINTTLVGKTKFSYKQDTSYNLPHEQKPIFI